MINFENLDKFAFPGVGAYDIPQLRPEKKYPRGHFIPANYALTAKDVENKNVHFFVDDYQFVRYWNNPDRYILRLSEFASVCAPNFSTYVDIRWRCKYTTITAPTGSLHTGNCMG